jgi:hypothetical protein
VFEEIIRTGRVATLRGTLIAGEADGLFRSDTDQSNYTLPVSTDDTGSV